MDSGENHLVEKFRRFRAAYDEARIWLVDSGGGAESIARNALAAARRDVPLTDEELQLYKEWILAND